MLHNLEIESFLICENGRYVSITHQSKEAIAILQEHKKNGNNKIIPYINGSIRIVYQYKVFVSEQYWDEVDTLWVYYLDLIERYLVHQQASTSFPESSTPISIKKVYQHLHFSVNHRKIVLDEDEFLTEMLNGAKHFFCFVYTATGDLHMKMRLERAEKIMSSIGL